MIIDFKKIGELYGNRMLELVSINKENVLENIMFFYKLGFTDPIDFFEKAPYIFINDTDYLKKKANKLFSRLGNNYINEIENDISLLEELA